MVSSQRAAKAMFVLLEEMLEFRVFLLGNRANQVEIDPQRDLRRRLVDDHIKLAQFDLRFSVAGMSGFAMSAMLARLTMPARLAMLSSFAMLPFGPGFHLSRARNHQVGEQALRHDDDGYQHAHNDHLGHGRNPTAGQTLAARLRSKRAASAESGSANVGCRSEKALAAPRWSESSGYDGYYFCADGRAAR